VSLKKDSLIRGTIILAAAALIARFLGIFQRVPLDYMLKEAGGAYFTAANNIYLLLLVVATAGIPSTISKMIAERHARGRIAEARDIYRAALLFGIVTGVVVSGALFVFAPLLARDNPGRGGVDPRDRAGAASVPGHRDDARVFPGAAGT
jgi:Membrane protein involved in the export of O-antigen and teichoic acid